MASLPNLDSSLSLSPGKPVAIFRRVRIIHRLVGILGYSIRSCPASTVSSGLSACWKDPERTGTLYSIYAPVFNKIKCLFCRGILDVVFSLFLRSFLLFVPYLFIHVFTLTNDVRRTSPVHTHTRRYTHTHTHRERERERRTDIHTHSHTRTHTHRTYWYIRLEIVCHSSLAICILFRRFQFTTNRLLFVRPTKLIPRDLERNSRQISDRQSV